MAYFADTDSTSNKNLYLVQSDDTFYKISRYYNITLEDLIEANPEIDPDNLEEGDEVAIPLHMQSFSCPIGAEAYTVKENDTIYTIAKIFNIKLNNLLKANPFIKPDAIMPGQIICIPKPWSTYTNSEYKVSFQYPVRWAKVSSLFYEGVDGFFCLTPLNSELELEELCRQEACHKLKPYGSRPDIQTASADDFPILLILPSADQPKEMKKQAALLFKYPVDIQAKEQSYNYLMLRADLEHINDIRDSLVILDK